MPNNISESGITFSFPDDNQVVKFDDTPFYRDFFNCLEGAKGVDIISNSSNRVCIIEVKNCTGHEHENAWRLGVNNSSKEKAAQTVDVENRDSLDIEVARKVAMTLCCIYGAWTKQLSAEKTDDIAFLWDGLATKKVYNDKKNILVVLVLEGNFGMKSRDKKTIMDSIQKGIKKQLKWLNCSVSVVDSKTYNNSVFSITI